jgi:phosphoenolpyruvate carboxykinase (ATP)
MEIAYTRAMVDAALEGELAKTKTEEHPLFGVNMPVKCPGVPAGVLNPRDSWADKDAYDAQALDLAARFVTSFEQFADDVSAEVGAAGPRV